jgi:hypothetical protein
MASQTAGEDACKTESPSLWEHSPGVLTHVKAVEVEFKELEFIDPSRMV